MNFVNSVNFSGPSAFVLYFLQNKPRPAGEVNEVNRVNRCELGQEMVKTPGKGGLLSVLPTSLMNINVLLCTYMRLSLSFAMEKFGGRELRVNFVKMKFTGKDGNAPTPNLSPVGRGINLEKNHERKNKN